MELSEHESGSRVHLAPGELLTVRLPENGGTAFLWHLDDSAADQGVILTDSDIEGGTGAPGSAGRRRLVFTVERPGVAELRLVRHRPWEAADQADAEFTLTLDVSA